MGLECQGPTGSPWAKALAVIGTWLGELELWGGRRCWWFRSGKCALEPDFYVFFSRNSWEFHHPNWRTPSFFQRSRSTTNQRLILLEVLAIHLCFTEESAEEPWRAGWKEATSATFSEAVTTKFARPHRGFGVCFFHCLVVTGTWMDYDFPETVGNFITPTDELHDFSEGLVETTNQFRFRDFGPTPTT